MYFNRYLVAKYPILLKLVEQMSLEIRSAIYFASFFVCLFVKHYFLFILHKLKLFNKTKNPEYLEAFLLFLD